MSDISRNLASVGARLRRERDRLGWNQAAMGEAGGVNRGTQADYEAGKRPFGVDYLFAIEAAGADADFILTGQHGGDRLEPEESDLLACYARLAPDQRDAVLTISTGLAGRAALRTVHAPATAFAAAPAGLPSQPALARALEGVLEVYSDLRGGELAQALARHLPSVLSAAADALPQQAASDGARPDIQAPDRPAQRPARRT